MAAIVCGPQKVPTVSGLGYSPPEVDRIWGIWGSYYSVPKAIFYLLKGGL